MPEQWRVEHGDCLEVMRTLEAASVDAIVTDPPYFRVKRDSWDRQWKKAGDFLAWLGEVADEWARVLKPNGSLYCFASPQMAARVECLIGERFTVLNSVRWYKDAGWHNKADVESLRSYLTPWEAVVFAEQLGDRYEEEASALHKAVYAPIGSKVAQKRIAAGLARHEVDSACAPSKKPTGLCYRWEAGDCLPTSDQFVSLCRLCGDRREYEDLRREYEDLRRPFKVTRDVPYLDVWHFDVVQGYRGKHPCEKPLAMMRHIVAASTRPDALVLDCFAGTGATGVACRQLGRRFVGIELSEEYATIARARIAEAAQQPDLFGGEA